MKERKSVMQNYGLKGGIIVIGKILDKKIAPLTLEILGAGLTLGKEMGCSVSVILSGSVCSSDLASLQCFGADEIICLEHPKLRNGCEQYHLEALRSCLVRKEPDVILVGADSSGRVLASQLAFELDTEIVTDAHSLYYNPTLDTVIIRRPAPDGTRMNEFRIETSPIMASFRQGICRKAVSQQAASGNLCKIYNVRVPAENMITASGDGFKLAMKTLDGGRIGVAAQGLGIAEGAFEIARQYLMTRE